MSLNKREKCTTWHPNWLRPAILNRCHIVMPWYAREKIIYFFSQFHFYLLDQKYRTNSHDSPSCSTSYILDQQQDLFLTKSNPRCNSRKSPRDVNLITSRADNVEETVGNKSASVVIYNKINHMVRLSNIFLFLMSIFMDLLFLICILKALVVDLKLWAKMTTMLHEHSETWLGLNAGGVDSVCQFCK